MLDKVCAPSMTCHFSPWCPPKARCFFKNQKVGRQAPWYSGVYVSSFLRMLLSSADRRQRRHFSCFSSICTSSGFCRKSSRSIHEPSSSPKTAWPKLLPEEISSTSCKLPSASRNSLNMSCPGTLWRKNAQKMLRKEEIYVETNELLVAKLSICSPDQGLERCWNSFDFQSCLASPPAQLKGREGRMCKI